MSEQVKAVTNREKQHRLLRSIDFFHSFDNDDLDELLGHCDIRRYSPNMYIIKEEMIGNSFFVILQGQVSIVKGNLKEGRHKLTSLWKGECFGEMAILLNDKRTASVVAETECVIFEIKIERIKDLRIETREKLYYQFAVALATRLKEISSKKLDDISAWNR